MAVARPALDSRFYDSDGVMIGHSVLPMGEPIDGVYWCRVCGGHPDDPIHQPGYKELDDADVLTLQRPTKNSPRARRRGRKRP